MDEASISTESLITRAEMARRLGVSRTYITLLSQGVVVQGKCQGLMFSDFVSRVNGTPL
jgi:predicted transcriptional regulator